MSQDSIYITWKMIAITLAIALAATIGVIFNDEANRLEKVEAIQVEVEKSMAGKD